MALEISKSTVTVCSADEVASLKAEAESLESAASELSAALTAAMSNLEGKMFGDKILNKFRDRD